MKNILISIAIAASVAVSTPASAWGDKEQGILIGLGSALIVGGALQRRNQETSYPNAYGNNNQFPPFRCTGSEINCAYERGVWERKRQEWEDAKQFAYLCGRYPDRAECGR